MAVVCCLIVVFSGLAGWFYADKFKKRKQFLDGAISFCKLYEQNLSFSREKFSDLIDKYIAQNKSVFRAFLFDIKNQNFNVSKIKVPEFLTKQEADLVTQMFANLGSADYLTEAERIKGFKSQFENFLKGASEDETQKGRLGFKLSLGLGLALAIIIF